MFRQNVRQYLEETAIPTLTMAEIEQLETEFSEVEVQNAIDSLVLGISPGLDGFTPRFYRTFKELLTPIMKKTFNSVSTSRPFAPQGMEAYISSIPKPEKDHTLCGNYRMISLTDIDLRLYTKIISNR